MTDADGLARLHAASMSVPRTWSAAEIEGLLAAPGAFAVEGPQGFALGRVAADECEILTLCVAPASRRQGVGADILAAFHAEAARRGATRAILEVAADNAPARALYARAGYREVGRRRGYYRHGDGHAVDALVLARRLAEVPGTDGPT